MGRAARIVCVCIALLVGAAGCSSSGGRLSRDEGPPATRSVPPGKPAPAKRGPAPRTARDGAPVGGPSHAELMRTPDAVPVAEPRSRYGNPRSYVVFGRTYRTLPSSRGYVERGIASWYGTKFHKRLTSSREPYDMYAMTAAHRSLPLPTYVRVTHLENGRSAVVRVNDRGPFHPGRIIDLSYAAAIRLGITEAGSGPVEVRTVEPGEARPSRPPSRAAAGPLRYFVQLGAYIDERNAERAYELAERLRPGLASMRPITRAGVRLHRVRIGPLSGLDETDRVLEGITAAGVRGAGVVIEGRNMETAEDDNA